LLPLVPAREKEIKEAKEERTSVLSHSSGWHEGDSYRESYDTGLSECGEAFIEDLLNETGNASRRGSNTSHAAGLEAWMRQSGASEHYGVPGAERRPSGAVRRDRSQEHFNSFVSYASTTSHTGDEQAL